VKNITALFLSTILIATPAARVYAQNNVNDYGTVDNSPRNRGYGFLMFEEPLSPKNIGMGSVGTALYGYGFRYYNPVQPFFSPTGSSYASAEFGQMPGEVNRGGIETAALFTEWFSAVGFFSSAVDFQMSDERGLGAVASSGTTIGALSVGYIRDNTAVGVALSMAEDRVWVGSTYGAFALSLGVGYKLLDDKLSLGAAWMNGVGWSNGFAGDKSRWRDGRVPVFARVGAAWSDTRWSIPYTVAADLAYRDEDGTFSAPVGVEVKALPYISLRVGKRIGWENEVMSFGIGFNIDRLSFDAAFTPTVFVDDYEMKWSMGFTYNMGGRGKVSTVKDEVKIVPMKKSASTEDESVPAEEESASAEEENVSSGESAATATEDESVVPAEESAPTEQSVPTETGESATDEADPGTDIGQPTYDAP